MSSKVSQKQLINDFISFTGSNEKVAYKTLKASNWRLDVACESYFVTNVSTPSSKSVEALGKLFEKYRLPTDDEGQTSVEGTMQYCNDVNASLENAEHLVLFEIIKAPAMGEMSKVAFVEAWSRIGADTIQKQREYLASQVKLLSSDIDLFKRVYKNTFISSKEKGQKALPLESAIAYWQVLFSPPGMQWVTDLVHWTELWTDFMQQHWNKSVNKDLWNQTEVFFEKVMADENLTFWSEDSAWPGIIDQFVEYAQKEKGLKPDTMETD